MRQTSVPPRRHILLMASFKRKSLALTRVEVTKLPPSRSAHLGVRNPPLVFPLKPQGGACLCVLDSLGRNPRNELHVLTGLRAWPHSLSTCWPQMCLWVVGALVLVSSIKNSSDPKIRLGVSGDNVVFLKVREGRVPGGP